MVLHDPLLESLAPLDLDPSEHRSSVKTKKASRGLQTQTRTEAAGRTRGGALVSLASRLGGLAEGIFSRMPSGTLLLEDS